MKKKIIIISTSIVLIVTSILMYQNYFKQIELVINDEVVIVDSKYEVDKQKDKLLKKYQEELIETSRSKVSDFEIEYNEQLDLTELEEIEITSKGDYTYFITVTHTVDRETTEVIPFEKKTVEDPNTYDTYSEVTTKGVNGSETTTFTNIYINGEWQNAIDIEIVTVDSTTEVTTKGTLPSSSGGSSNGNYSSGGNYNNGSSGGSSSSGGYASGGSTGNGGVTVTPPPPPTNLLWYYVIDGYGWGTTGYSTEYDCYIAVENFKGSNPQLTGGYSCWQK